MSPVLPGSIWLQVLGRGFLSVQASRHHLNSRTTAIKNCGVRTVSSPNRQAARLTVNRHGSARPPLDCSPQIAHHGFLLFDEPIFEQAEEDAGRRSSSARRVIPRSNALMYQSYGGVLAAAVRERRTASILSTSSPAMKPERDPAFADGLKPPLD
ncbi:hypothetical protein Q31a_30700 [Aureliella helgolandensis]|uniref:Uncharacterized protein n=1 Tax=Aureliella helgolandensis TaxID=2527968 RepID=A0A518G839_9BACT|nr:hypothetical protein Q31a_30700 [Aureliella helgolandensis]